MNTSKYGAERSMLEPDIILPAQFFANVSSGLIYKSGEHRLLWAVLADAIDCFQGFLHATTPKRRRLFEEAEWWIMHQEIQPTVAGDAKQRVLLFEEVCAALGLDADYLRAGLRRWRNGRTLPTSRGCERGNRDAHDDPM